MFLIAMSSVGRHMATKNYTGIKYFEADASISSRATIGHPNGVSLARGPIVECVPPPPKKKNRTQYSGLFREYSVFITANFFKDYGDQINDN